MITKKLLRPFSEEALSTYQYLFINLLEEKKFEFFNTTDKCSLERLI